MSSFTYRLKGFGLDNCQIWSQVLGHGVLPSFQGQLQPLNSSTDHFIWGFACDYKGCGGKWAFLIKYCIWVLWIRPGFVFPIDSPLLFNLDKSLSDLCWQVNRTHPGYTVIFLLLKCLGRHLSFLKHNCGDPSFPFGGQCWAGKLGRRDDTEAMGGFLRRAA